MEFPEQKIIRKQLLIFSGFCVWFLPILCYSCETSLYIPTKLCRKFSSFLALAVISCTYTQNFLHNCIFKLSYLNETVL